MVALTHLADRDFLPANMSWRRLGWGTEQHTENTRQAIEASQFEQAFNATPELFRQRAAITLEPRIEAKWQKYQAERGYEEGSADLSLFGAFMFGSRYHWKPQKTGSCTISNTFRCWYRRALYEIAAKGQLERLLGTTEYGTTSVSFYAPISYGIAREIGNLRGGDGGFCSSTIRSLQKGVVACNNGKLLELLHKLGADNDKDFPEPQNNAVYRKFQDWTYNDEFEPFLEHPLVESVKCTNTAQLVENLKQYKPAIICSMVAVKKAGDYQGLSYFRVNRNDKWAHNMCWCGYIKWHGREFLLLSNESWRDNLIYPIPIEEVDEVVFPKYRPEVSTLGEIDLSDAQMAA